jgi:glycosyltransferase involved in cell wall biosynthesis
MRLLIVAESGSAHTGRWARFFAARGHRVLVVSQTPDLIDGVEVASFPPARALWSRLPRNRLGGGWPRWLAGYPEWRSLVRGFAPDLVHVHYLPGQARDVFYYRGLRPLVVSSWGSDVVFEPDHPPSAARARRLRSLLRQATAITATTRFLAGETRRFMSDDRDVEVIPFGVDTERFAPAPPPDPAAPAIGFTKSLEGRYGPQILVEAFLAIASAHPRATLEIAGDGSMRSRLEHVVASSEHADRVRFHGRIHPDRIHELTRRFSIAAMPSVCRESFGVAAIEASACGIPVVASDIGGIPEAVVHGRTGLLVAPGDPRALAEALGALLGDPERRRRLGEAGRELVLERYEWGHVGSRMEALYRRLLGPAAAADAAHERA